MNDEWLICREAAQETPELMEALACISPYRDVFQDAEVGCDDEGQACVHFDLVVPYPEPRPWLKGQYDWCCGRIYRDHVDCDLFRDIPDTGITKLISQDRMSVAHFTRYARRALVAWRGGMA